MWHGILSGILRPLRPAARLAVRLKRACRVRAFHQKMYRTIAVHGGRHLRPESELNLGGLDAPEVEVVFSPPDRSPFADASVARGFSITTLEHVNLHDIRLTLAEFRRLLKPEGSLSVASSGLHRVHARSREFGGTDALLRYLHGAHNDAGDFHLCVPDAKRSAWDLRDCAFAEPRDDACDESLHAPTFLRKFVARQPLPNVRPLPASRRFSLPVPAEGTR